MGIHRKNFDRIPHMIIVVTFLAVTSNLWGIDIQQEIILPAQSYIGSGYCRGGTASPCFDCSGFVTAIYRSYVPSLPRISRDMARVGQAVARDRLQPGDLVFFATSGRSDQITHVAIYIGQDSIIHAISDGPNRGVAVTPLSARYWRTRFHSARRVLPSGDVEQSRSVVGIKLANGVYTGSLSNGEPSGTGVLALDNGDRYEGAFQNGVFHGEGIYLWATGDRYSGAFRDGTLHGPGVLTTSTGTRTVGRWANGVLVDTDTPQAKPTPETYDATEASPWDTWDGIVEGDYYAWRDAEDDAFKEFQAEDNAWR